MTPGPTCTCRKSVLAHVHMHMDAAGDSGGGKMPSGWGGAKIGIGILLLMYCDVPTWKTMTLFFV